MAHRRLPLFSRDGDDLLYIRAVSPTADRQRAENEADDHDAFDTFYSEIGTSGLYIAPRGITGKTCPICQSGRGFRWLQGVKEGTEISSHGGTWCRYGAPISETVSADWNTILAL